MFSCGLDALTGVVRHHDRYHTQHTDWQAGERVAVSVRPHSAAQQGAEIALQESRVGTLAPHC